MLLFQSMPLVFETLGSFGKIVSFLFFGMVVIAALTSVISLLEVVTQFVIQKFRIHRKKAILIVSLICFALSVPISISLGYSINGENILQILGKDLLTFIDDITNTVLMPVCALGSCIALGWFIVKASKPKEAFSPMHLYRGLEEDGLKLGKFGKIFAVMIKYVSPILIAVIEVFGVINLIFPASEETGIRAFDKYGMLVVGVAYGILAIAIAVYYIFLKDKETGCNADEIDVAIEAMLDVEEEEEVAE